MLDIACPGFGRTDSGNVVADSSEYEWLGFAGGGCCLRGEVRVLCRWRVQVPCSDVARFLSLSLRSCLSSVAKSINCEWPESDQWSDLDWYRTARIILIKESLL